MFLRQAIRCGVLGAMLVACSSDSNGGGSTSTGGDANGGNDSTAGGNGGSSTGGTSGGTNGGSMSSGGSSAGTGGSSQTGGTGGSSGGATSTGGNGGTTDTGGGGGDGGTTDTGGSGGTTDTGGTGGSVSSGPSSGCMKSPPADENIGSAVLHTIDITGMAQEYVAGYTHRKFCTTIPNNYDSSHAYPVVFYGPGCGATACEGDSFTGSDFRDDIFIVQAIAGADAKTPNIVPPNGSPGCFQAGKEGTDDSPEGPYFDQVMAQVEATYCIDKGKIFAAGTSSGAWLSNYLACARGGIIRGTAADSGGLQFAHGTCSPGAAVMELPGDSTTTSDQEGHEIGSGLARDMFIQLNGCSSTPTMMNFGPANNCQIYGGCASPVVWCNVGGGHQSGNGILAATSWAFWSTLQ